MSESQTEIKQVIRFIIHILIMCTFAYIMCIVSTCACLYSQSGGQAMVIEH